MASLEIDQLFAQTLMGDYDGELPWKAVSALRRIGTREVFDQAATWCKSDNPLKRARGAAILAQLGKTAEHSCNKFPEESYESVCQMLQLETEPQPLSSAIHALGHLGNPKAIPVIIGYREHSSSDVRFFPWHVHWVHSQTTLKPFSRYWC